MSKHTESMLRLDGGPTGWICPRCGKANAPWVPSCPCSVPVYRPQPTYDLPPLTGDPLPKPAVTIC